MASLKDIRRRIGSVKNTQQITKAMKMVAAAKLRRAQQAVSGARPFAEKLEEVTSRIVAEILQTLPSGDESKAADFLSNLHPLLKRPSVAEGAKEKIALLVVTSDRGLCGAYNTNVIKFAVRRHRELVQEGKDVELAFVGKKGSDFFTKRGLAGQFFADFWAGTFSVQKSDKVAAQFVGRFLAGEIQGVEVCFTQFSSAISQTAMSKKVLPLTVSVKEEGAHDGVVAAPFIYEPDRGTLLAQVLPQQVKTQFYRLFADSLASEHGSRMTSMDNATRNARDMISRLTLEANRVRQAGITRELMEIIGGAEALK